MKYVVTECKYLSVLQNRVKIIQQYYITWMRLRSLSQQYYITCDNDLRRICNVRHKTQSNNPVIILKLPLFFNSFLMDMEHCTERGIVWCSVTFLWSFSTSGPETWSSVHSETSDSGQNSSWGMLTSTSSPCSPLVAWSTLGCVSAKLAIL